jgi:hypothetical protein
MSGEAKDAVMNIVKGPIQLVKDIEEHYQKHFHNLSGSPLPCRKTVSHEMR